MTQYLIMPTKRTPHSRRNPKQPRAFSRRSGNLSHAAKRTTRFSRRGSRSAGPVIHPGIPQVGNGLFGRAARGADQHAQGPSPTKRETARSRALNATVVSVPTEGGTLEITRRHFVIGAVGIAALAGIGAAAGAVAGHLRDASADNVDVLTVPEAAVTTNDSLSESDLESHLSLAGSYELTYGTQVWASGDDVACCLVPGETSTPLSTVELLWLGSGQTQVALGQAVGQADGYNIFDARATGSGLVWVEADILEGAWRVYTAALSNGEVLEPTLVEEGQTLDWETPQIAAVGTTAYWQVMPRADGDYSTEPSLLRAASFGSPDARDVYSSAGRMATPPYAAAGGVVITPRADTSGVHYQLTLISEQTDEVLDAMTLPQSMSPLEAGYGDTGFMFSFDAIYNYGDGISQLGTYVPLQAAAGADYSGVPWYRYNRNPTAPPAWCGGYLFVKALTSVVGVDFSAGNYFQLGVESGADDYGDYLASSGSNGTVVTFSNINSDPLEGEARTCCLVRVWTPVSA